MSETLKPCPFCGDTNPRISNGGGTIFVQCIKCDTDGPYFDEDHREKAVTSWNTRADDNRWRSVAEQEEKALKGIMTHLPDLAEFENSKGESARPFTDAATLALAAFDSLRKEEG